MATIINSTGEQDQTEDNVLFTGSCFCRAVTFTLSELPMKAYLCHCLNCRRSTGSSFAYNAAFPRSALKLSFQKPARTAFASPTATGSEDARGDAADDSTAIDESVISTFGVKASGMRKFCSLCGTRLLIYVREEVAVMQDKVIIPVGVIDGSEKDERLRPTAEAFCERREEWMPDMRGTEAFDKMFTA
ncbi:hypothetical protein PMZ80_003045 [Knufia obscura]|uniref:CENP-V/GFA domain-containing protein n=2 Tax=Knufia TaxID=430999 RepID=A0AAN8I357_9EURO|nr:hypothetical protein PMZ80_003045 [Knufia obscura]KAK5952367.1 hypothetical protein OHC33_006410 [Knufia fluminis]